MSVRSHCLCIQTFHPHREGAFRGSKDSFDAELDESSNYYLVDAQLPKAAPARRIETCSPKHSKQWVRIFVLHLVSMLALCLICTSTQDP